MTIYIAKSGQTTGPFDLEAVNAKLQRGELAPTDLCWSEGAANWGPLSSLEGVQIPEAGTVPPPPPPVTPQAGHSPMGLPPTGMPITGMPPLPPSSPYPPTPTAYPNQQAFPNPRPYPTTVRPSPTSPTSAPADADDFEERVIFAVSAFPLAVSLKDLVLSFVTVGAWLVFVIARNSTTRYKLTNQRLTLRSGLLSQHIEEVEVFRIRDVSVQQGTGGLLFGFGDVIVHASDASSPRLVLRRAPSPGKIKEQIRTASRQGRKSEGVRAMEHMG